MPLELWAGKALEHDQESLMSHTGESIENQNVGENVSSGSLASEI